MYSLVLMLALSGSAQTPAGLFHHDCSGGSGCCGGTVYYDCSGGSGCCGGTVYYDCTGGCFGHGGLLRRIMGHFHSSGCCGGLSCDGGCCGGMSCGGGCIGAVAAPSAPVAPAPALPEAVPAPKEKVDAGQPAAAKIVVDLPVDAKLFVNDQPTVSTTGRRTLVTPVLDPNFKHTYTLRVEVVRNGKVMTEIKDVMVEPGEASQATFAGLEMPRSAAIQAVSATDK